MTPPPLPVPAPPLLRVTGILWSSRLLAALIGIAGNLLLAQLLGVAAFGQLAVLVATALLVVNLLDPFMADTGVAFLSRFRAAGDVRRTGAMVRLCFLLTGAGGLLGTMALVALPYVLPGALPEGTGWTLVGLGLAQVARATAVVALAVLRVYERHVPQAIYSIALSTLQTLLYVALVGVFDFGFPGVAWSQLVAALATLVHPTLFLLRVLKGAGAAPGAPGAPVARLASVGREIGWWVLHVKLHGILKLGRELDVILLNLVTGPATVGIFSAAARVASFANVLFEPLFGVLYPEMARAAAGGDHRAIGRIVRVVSYGGTAAAAVMLGLFALLGRPAIAMTLGPDFLPAYAPVLILLLAQIPQEAVAWGRPLFLSVGLAPRYNAASAVALAVRVALVVPASLALSFNGPPVATLAGQLVLAALVTHWGRRWLRRPPPNASHRGAVHDARAASGPGTDGG